MSGDPFAVLGVERGCGADAIKGAFRQRAKDAHPDKGGDAEQFHALKRYATS
jgi:curved DNA-binding protein CbpA